MTKINPPIAEDYCTVAYAAEHAGVSIRTVTRAVAAGTLSSVRPRVAARESSRHKLMLRSVEVVAWSAARKLAMPRRCSATLDGNRCVHDEGHIRGAMATSHFYDDDRVG